MRTLSMRLWRAALLLVLVVVALTCMDRHEAPARPESIPADKYVSTTQCNQCHTDPNGLPTDLCRLDEFYTWRTRDKHSQAYAVLRSERGKRMGVLLEVNVTAPEAGCLGCHSIDKPELKDEAIKKTLLTDGVGCEACHGAAKDWLTPHTDSTTWRNKTNAEKQKLGMIPLRDPEVRAQVCQSCHVGNAAEGKVVTHAMYAAGHPPLPSFEVSAFSEYMPRHWHPLRDVPWLKKGANEEQRKNFGYDGADVADTRLALIGSVSQLKGAAELMKDRADGSAKFGRQWPELMGKVNVEAWDAEGLKTIDRKWRDLSMTHFDCTSCHHDLNVPSWRRVRGYRVAPGRPTPPEWLRTLLPTTLSFARAGKVDDATLDKDLANFDAACTRIPFGKPTDIVEAAPKLAKWCDDLLAQVKSKTLTKDETKKLLMQALDAGAATPPKDSGATEGTNWKLGTANGKVHDYDSARQLVAFIDTAYRELSVGAKDVSPEVAKTLDDLKEKLNLVRDTQDKEREEVVRQAVSEVAKKPLAKNELEFKQQLMKSVAKDGLSEALASEKYKYLGKLSELNEKAQALTAQRLAKYDPEAVQKALAKIRGLLKDAKW
jgi:Cytochrome c554 and c-prime